MKLCPWCNQELDKDNRCWDCGAVFSFDEDEGFSALNIFIFIAIGLSIWKLVDIVVFIIERFLP